MNRIFRLIATLVALAPLSGSVALAGVSYSERSDRVVDVRGLTALDVNNASGLVQLRPSPDGRLHVTAVKVCRARDRALATRLCGETSVETGAVGSRFDIRVRYPRRIDVHVDFWELFHSHGDDTGFWPHLEVQLLLEVPANLALHVQTSSGDIQSEGMSGTQRLYSSSGDVTVHRSSGPLTVETSSGDLAVEQVVASRLRSSSGDIGVKDAGALDASTVSGDLSVQGARDSLVLNTTSGDIVVQDAPHGIDGHTISGQLRVRGSCGHVTLGSQSGDVRARVRGPLLAADVESVSGEVGLELAQGMDASLELGSSSGDLDCQAPVRLLQHDRNSLSAQYGRGGPRVRLRTSSGDIHVTSGGR